MPFSVRHLTLDDKMCHQVRLDMLEAIIPADTIRHVLSSQQAWDAREKKLNMQLIVYLIIALALFPAQSTAHVLRTLTAGLHHLWPQPAKPLANKSAISTRRKHMGEQPMQTLFSRVVHPIATPQTKGAFRFGRLLVAVDNVPDTAANRAAFGYSRKTGPLSPYPQVRCVYLSECGTHAVIYEDAKHQRGKQLLVRVIEYTVTDPRFPQAGTTQRLVTTLLNPRLYPAVDLIDTHHERWEIESSIDEYQTHQRLSARTLRSQTPEGVRQELWGVLLVHYAIRVLMHQSALQADRDPDRPCRPIWIPIASVSRMPSMCCMRPPGVLPSLPSASTRLC
jgi:hypothetical protein